MIVGPENQIQPESVGALESTQTPESKRMTEKFKLIGGETLQILTEISNVCSKCKDELSAAQVKLKREPFRENAMTGLVEKQQPENDARERELRLEFYNILIKSMNFERPNGLIRQMNKILTEVGVAVESIHGRSGIVDTIFSEAQFLLQEKEVKIRLPSLFNDKLDPEELISSLGFCDTLHASWGSFLPKIDAVMDLVESKLDLVSTEFSSSRRSWYKMKNYLDSIWLASSEANDPNEEKHLELYTNLIDKMNLSAEFQLAIEDQIQVIVVQTLEFIKDKLGEIRKLYWDSGDNMGLKTLSALPRHMVIDSAKTKHPTTNP